MTRPKDQKRPSLKKWAFAAFYALTAAYYRFRPQPQGVNPEPRAYRVPAEQISFSYDAVWHEEGQRQTVRQIADEVLAVIERARSFVVLDVFLFNLHHASQGEFVPTTRQIADALGAKLHPKYFITDPLNTFYGTEHSEPIAWLREAGVEVCFTDLRRLRDNNIVYSPFWRLFCQWFGTNGAHLVDHPLRQGQRTTLPAFLEALNARANHRKVVVADAPEGYVTLITSSNFEDASSYFANVALTIRSGAVARHFLEAERAVARMSGCDLPVTIPAEAARDAAEGDATVTPLMGRAIKAHLLADLRGAEAGDEVFLLVLFLSDRDVVEALIAASDRGAHVTAVLDANEVTFGEEKKGFPNQLVAAEIARRSGATVRMANTEGEEFHTKMAVINKGGHCILHLGSANFDRRSLSDTNLEANVRVETPRDAAVCQDVFAYLDGLTREPQSYAADGDPSGRKYWWYRLQEATGAATF